MTVVAVKVSGTDGLNAGTGDAEVVNEDTLAAIVLRTVGVKKEADRDVPSTKRLEIQSQSEPPAV